MAKKNNQFEDIGSFSSKQEYKKTRKKSSKAIAALKVFICFLSVILIVVGGGLVYVADNMVSELNTVSISKDKDDLGINEGAFDEEGVTNIALFGVDTRNSSSYSGRSDVIMIVSIDEVNNKIKMTSILRDSRVYMGDGYVGTSSNYDKINHAYVYGGAELAIKVINTNYNLNIEDYVTVNFSSTADIIDAFGGVDIEITQAEMVEINKNLGETSPSDTISSYGNVHLDGDQAVAYGRIRSIGGDDGRAGRQQYVLTELFNKLLEMDSSSYLGLISEVCGFCETSLSVETVATFIPFVVEGFTIEKITIPDQDVEGYSSGYMENGGWMWTYDTDVAAQHIYDFVTETGDYEVFMAE